MKNFLINISFLIASLTICLLVADLTLKALRLPKDSHMVTLLSGSSMYTDEYGVRRYEPDKEIDQSAVIDLKIGYRFKFRTNNLGFASKYDYKPGETLDVMMVGDSMAMGYEVGPWLDTIQQHLLNAYGISSQNLSMPGNGFIELKKAATFAKERLNAKKAILIFNFNGMHRPGDVMVANQDCSTYKSYTSSEINCFSGRPTWHYYDQSLSNEELISFAKNLELNGLYFFIRKSLIVIAKKVVGAYCQTEMRIDETNSLAIRINRECEARDWSKNRHPVKYLPESIRNQSPPDHSAEAQIAQRKSTKTDIIPKYTADSVTLP
jgi:hypothetical protein